MKRHWRNTAVLLAVMVLLAACNDNQLATVSNALYDTAHGIAVLQATVIDGNKQGLISESDTRKILTVVDQIDTAGKQSITLTRNIQKLNIQKLNTQDKTSLLVLLQPILVAINDAVATDTVGIKDDKTKQAVQTVLVAIQTSLNVINSTLTH